jgi:hypothetical protein
LVWVDEGWDHETATVALTTVTFAPETGEILGADIELNSEGFQFTVRDAGYGMDLGSTVTHELGHVLGLAHTDDRDATMTQVQMRGEVDLQTLGADDAEGLCSIYPPGASMAPCDPDYDFSPRCGGDVVGGCAISAGRPPLGNTPAAGWLCYAALAIVVLLRLSRALGGCVRSTSRLALQMPANSVNVDSCRDCPSGQWSARTQIRESGGVRRSLDGRGIVRLFDTDEPAFERDFDVAAGQCLLERSRERGDAPAAGHAVDTIGLGVHGVSPVVIGSASNGAA